MTGALDMLLPELFRDCSVDAPALRVTNLSTRSRRLTPGSLFLACAGQRHHGLHYLDQALVAGAVAVAWEPAAGVAPPQTGPIPSRACSADSWRASVADGQLQIAFSRKIHWDGQVGAVLPTRTLMRLQDAGNR